MKSEILPHLWLPEPKLSFHPDRTSDQSGHPLEGLKQFGPYSAGLVPDPIRVATIAPYGDRRKLFDFMRSVKLRHLPKERKGYLPEWPGFRETFRVDLKPASEMCLVELDKKFEASFCSSQKPHVVLAERLSRTIQGLNAHRAHFEVVFIYIPRRWEPGYVGPKGEDFDLHDHLKAFTAGLGIPIQLVREDSAISYSCRASVMWRIGLATYVKAGGIPWKLAEADEETAYIGISYAVRSVDSDNPKFITCCSQVFDSEGAGLEFLAYDAHEFEVHRDNPFLSRTEMFRVMTRSMDLYRRRHAGRTPRRVMVHKSTEFKREEIDGCLEAFHLCESVDLLQIVGNARWRGVRIDERDGQTKGVPAAFPVLRGTLVGLGPRDALLWTHGNVQGVTGQSYFQGSRSTPRPIRLVRHAGHGTWEDTVRAILGLSKMNWNNDSLYDPLPVTMRYASVLARVVKSMPNLGSRPYQFRFFM